MNLTGTRIRARNHAGICGRAIAPCADALEPRLLFAQEAEPADLETLGPYVLFTQFDVEYGRELWRSDGAPGGTALVKDINPGPADGASRSAGGIMTVGNVAYFVADDGVHGRELWRTDGTAAGTAMVEDLTPGAGSSGIGEFFVEDGVFYFTSNDASYRALRVPGSPSGAVSPAGGETFIDWLRRPKLNGRGFSTHDGKLWAKVAPDAADTLIFDPGPDPSNQLFGAAPTLAGDTLFFRGGNYLLYASDGTTAGTRRIAAAPPARTGLVGGPDGRVYFGLAAADAIPQLLSGHGYLWASDGTEAGTVQVAEVGANVSASMDFTPTPLIVNGGKLYFRAAGSGGGPMLSFVDLASGETRQVPASLSADFWMPGYRIDKDVAFVNGDLMYALKLYGDVFAAFPAGNAKPALVIMPESTYSRELSVDDGMPMALKAVVAAPGHDATHDPIQVTWDLDSDGVFDDAAGESVEVPPADVARFGASGSFFARARASDSGGPAATSLSVRIHLNQVPPSAAPEAPYTYARAGEIEFAIVYSDPSGVDPASLVGNDGLVAVGINPAAPVQFPARYVGIDAEVPGPSRTVVYRATLPAGTVVPQYTQLYTGFVGQARDMLGNAGVSGAFPPILLYELSADGTGPAPGAGLGVPPNVRGTLTNVFILAGEEATTPLAMRRVYSDVNGNNAFDAAEPNAITDLEGKFGFFAVPGGTVRVELSEDWAPAEGSPATVPVNLRPNQPALKFSMSRPVVVDVLVAYSGPEGGLGVGGTQTIRDAVKALVLGVNQVFANSETNVVLNLAGVLRVFYQSTGHPRQDLMKLRKLGDGPLDEVHAERERVGADITVLVTPNDERKDRVAGISFQLQRPGGEPDDAFAVVTNISLPMLFAHEVGHLFGAGHEKAVTKYGIRPYAHGYVYQSADPLGLGFMDVMSYGAPGQLPLPFLSNPRLSYQGVPTGDAAGADNARTVREFAPVIAAYRSAPAGGPVGQPPAVDLAATLQVKAPPRVRPGATLNVTVTLTNRGTASAVGVAGAAVYLSNRADRQTLDVPLASAPTTLNLKGGKSKRVRLRAKIPANLAPGTYYLVGSAGGGPVGIDADPSNNERVAGPDVVVAG